MALVKYDSGKRESSLTPWFNDVFDTFFNNSFLSDRMVLRVPAVNIAETDNTYHIELAAPGLKKEDFKINLDQNVLSISAEKKEEVQEGKKYDRKEYSYSSFVRSFTLPDTVDDVSIEAEYTDGILKIDVAKREEAKSPARQINIK